jgi:hypothetical protein
MIKPLWFGGGDQPIALHRRYANRHYPKHTPDSALARDHIFGGALFESALRRRAEIYTPWS